MKTIVYYHKNSNGVAFERIKDSYGFSCERTFDENGNVLTFKNSDGFSWEKTWDKNGNQLTYKDSNDHFEIKCKSVTKEKFENFINNQNRPCVGKKVVVDGIEYELK